MRACEKDLNILVGREDVNSNGLGFVCSLRGQPVTVENVPGAGATAGPAQVAKSPADGYTLLVNTSAQAYSAALLKKLPYDPLKDFIPVAPLTRQPYVLVTGKQTGITTVGELVAAAKATPGQSCSKKSSLDLGRGGAFFLTSLFVEFIDRGMSLRFPMRYRVTGGKRVPYLNGTPFPAAARRFYWIELATEEKALFAFDPTKRIVPTTRTKMTASITAYSAMSWPSSSFQRFRGRYCITLLSGWRYFRVAWAVLTEIRTPALKARKQFANPLKDGTKCRPISHPHSYRGLLG